MSLSRTLFRSLLRTMQQVERHSNSHTDVRVAQAFSHLKPKKDVPLTQQLRDAFRAPPPDVTIDDAFTALRVGNECLSWLRVNHRLHELHEQHADVSAGACVIADALHDSPSSCMQHVADELDSIAESVRSLLPAKGAQDATSAGRLRTIEQINKVLFDRLGFRGEYGDIAASSSIKEVLARRRGLPVTLCVVYQAVAQRLGLPVAFTNFPMHVLLRLEAQADGDVASKPRSNLTRLPLLLSLRVPLSSHSASLFSSRSASLISSRYGRMSLPFLPSALVMTIVMTIVNDHRE